MEILINENQLEIAPDFAIEMEESNPFFSETGAQSLPVKLPFSAHNLAALNYPERIARYSKLNTEYECVIRHGVWQKNGKLIVFSASKADGISATFYMNDGEFYTMVKDVKMTDIKFYNNEDPYEGTYAEKATQWMQHFEQVQAGNIVEDYQIFPVATKVIKSDFNPFFDDYHYINQPDESSSANPHSLVGYSERTIDDVVCPVGYGVSPFLKLNFLLKMVFLHFDYTLQESLFDTDADLAKLVVLNNCNDAICSGKLKYRNLVPTVTVSEFLEILQNKFCCIFVPFGRTKTVEIHFFETSQTLTPDMDISPFVIDSPVITHEPFKQLKLSAAASIESAEPPTETFEKLVYENDYITPATESQFNQTTIMVNEVVLRLALGKYYRQVSSDTTIAMQEIGSAFFNYDKKVEKLEYDERETKDEQVPLFFRSNYFFLPLIGQGRNINTGIKNGKEITEEKEGDCKVMFCFYIGNQTTHYVCGTPFNYDIRGNKTGNFSLQYAGNSLIDGLFQTFWKTCDSLLRHAFRTVTCKLNMPISDFLKFNISTPKLINGTPVMPVNIKYSIDSNKGLVIQEAEFKTLRLMKPYDISAENTIPQFNNSQYYWLRGNNLSDMYE
jgi:hypothetical protein